MPIPFRDEEAVADLGEAAFLTVRPLQASAGFEGALFVVNARGEPREFSYNRVTTPHPFLWRRSDLHRHAQRRLASSLFSVCPVVPVVILCLAEEIAPALFAEDLQVSVPVCRMAGEAAALPSGSEVEAVDTGEATRLLWHPRLPDETSRARLLVQELARRGLLAEPFARAKEGLDEVYRDTAGPEA